MDNSGSMDGHCCHEDLAEEVAGDILGQEALLCDVVKEVGNWIRPLHDKDETVRPLVIVQEFYDAIDGANLLKQGNLHWNVLPIDLYRMNNTKLSQC